MIAAYLTICLLHLPTQDPCWPEKVVGQFNTTELCWKAIDTFMAKNGKSSDSGAGPISINWRCGGDT